VGVPRIVAAALTGLVMAVVLVALASGAAARGSATVTLQIAPRGLGGSLTVDPPGLDVDTQTLKNQCTNNESQVSCTLTYDRGTKVTLTGSGQGSSFASWSTPDCPGTGSCTLTLNDDTTSIVALFNPLHLLVRFSPADAAVLTTDPVGKACGSVPSDAQPDDKCFEFAPGTSVKLTEKPKQGDTNPPAFQGWGPSCQPTDQPTCTIVVNDEPTWAGALFAGGDDLNLPTTISVQFQLKRSGTGSGRVTGPNLDCGTVCAGQFGYGKPLTLTAAPDAGSTFDGWNGVCAKTQTTCTFPVGPITAIKAIFARDTTPPTTPGALTVTATTRTSIAISWTPSTDNIGVTGYRVYIDAVSADTTSTNYTFTNLTCGRSYALAVDAADAVGNRSPRATLAVSTKPCALAARIAGVGVERVGRLRRVLVMLRVNRATSAQLALVLRKRTVARARLSVRPGTNALRLAVPRALKAGPYRLTIALANPDGGTLLLPARALLIPRVR
jgi:hypothetical protein